MDAPSFDAPAAEWLVYADALQQKGDPRGELIALVNAGDAAKREAFVAEHAQALLGAAAPHFPAQLTLTWRWCFVDSAEVRAGDAKTLGAALEGLLAAPVAERLRALALVGVPGNDDARIDLAPVLERVTDGEVPASLSELSLVDARAAQSTSLTSRDFSPAENLVTFGSLEKVWRMKGLRSLKVVMADVQQLEPGTIDAPGLTSLTVHGLRLGTSFGGTSTFANALTAAKLPALKHFDARLPEEWVMNYLDDDGAYTSHGYGGGYGDYGSDDASIEGTNWGAELGDALRNLVACPLERLALTSFDSTESLLELLAETGLPPTLKELDLSDSALSTSDLAWFTAHKAMLSKLERLVVKNTGLTDDDARALAALGPKVEHSHRAPPELAGFDEEPLEPEEGEEPRRTQAVYRYVVGME